PVSGAGEPHDDVLAPCAAAGRAVGESPPACMIVEGWAATTAHPSALFQRSAAIAARVTHIFGGIARSGYSQVGRVCGADQGEPGAGRRRDDCLDLDGGCP